ncbi:MAG: RelA/SpoT family protein [Arenimonas sp.]
MSSTKLPRLSDWLEQAKGPSERGDALWQAVQALAQSLPNDASERETIALLDSLLALKVSPDVLLAAALASWPGLQAAINPKQEGLSRLQPLLDGIKAAEQVWSLHAQRENPGNSEGLRRLLLALVRDLRVVPILLAMQLQRLRQAGQYSEQERRTLAQLTADIHSPLANRLGIWQLKWELEDLAFRYLQPETYQKIAKLLDEKRTGREKFIEQVKQKMREALLEAGIEADIAGRPKHIYSIWKKMQRKNVPFSELYDIRAIRVLVKDIPSCYTVLGVVHQLWPSIPSEYDDYIAHPKGNDYRSLHTAVLGPDNRTLEIQIRTPQMHEHAELGVAAHWRYKEGGSSDASFERKVAWMRQLLEQRDHDESHDLLAGFSTELMEDRVYLLTPKGEVFDLTHGSTVLDFAYHVHTEVGHRCRGAKVNGRIVTLDFKPSSGDRIEIITSKVSEPRRDWLMVSNGFLVSGRARDKVRAWFHKIDRARNLQAGRDILEKELRRVALLHADLAPILVKFRLPNTDELYLALALGDVGPNQISRALHEHQQTSKLPEAVKPTPKKYAIKKNAGQFTVEGVGNLLTQLARCCQPVPGDEIIGYLTRGRGVSIHRASCASLQRLQSLHEDRCLPVNWGESDKSRYLVNVVVRAFDRKWLLKDITNIIGQNEVQIQGVDSKIDSSHGMAEINFLLKVNDFEQLSDLLGRLNAVPGIQEARRLG